MLAAIHARQAGLHVMRANIWPGVALERRDLRHRQPGG